MTNPGRVLLGAFVVTMAIVTWDEVKRQKRMPVPHRYIAVGMVYAILGIVATLGAPELAAIFGVGVILAQTYATASAGASGVAPVGGGLIGGKGSAGRDKLTDQTPPTFEQL